MDTTLPPVRLTLSSNPAARRRLTAVLMGCFAAMVTGAEVGARSGQDPLRAPAPEVAAQSGAPGPAAPAVPEDARAAAGELSLERQIGQLVMLGFDGTELSSPARAALERGRASGAIVFEDNAASAPQLEKLTRSLQGAAGGSALVGVDQEGGEVRRLPFAAPAPSPATVNEPAAAARLGRDAARDLTAAGINVNFAPVADIATSARSVMAGRAYPGDADHVAAMVRAAIQGQSSGGLASTAKHFPGLGPSLANTDFERATVGQSRERIERVELEPFRAAVDADVELVMASHALYPALDERRIASQSREVLGEMLREDVGHEGVVVTDALEAEAVTSRTSLPTAAVRSVAAGADLVLTTEPDSHEPVYERLLAEARRSDEFRARVEESAARVLALKERMGLEPPRGGRS